MAGWDFQKNVPTYLLSYTNSEIVPVTLSASGDRRGSSLGANVSLPLLLSMERQQVVSVGYERAVREPQEEDEGGESTEEAPGGPTVTHSITGSYSYTRSTRSELFADQLGISLSGRLFREEGDDVWHQALTFRWQESLRVPVKESNWVRMRFLAGWTDSEKERDAFKLGGPYGPFVLRGFAPEAFSGRQVVSLGAPYVFPLFSIERGLGGWPIFFDDLGARLFVDAGLAGDQLDVGELKLGFGVEISLSVTTGYVQNLTVLVGVGQGLGEPRPLFYFNMDLPFF
jgi:hypothetical protein